MHKARQTGAAQNACKVARPTSWVWVLFVGGGAVALAERIRDWFPNQALAEHPAFANARGMLKYLRFVCEAPI